MALSIAEPRPPRLFISYAHRDDQFREELETHLKPLMRMNVVQVWSDRQIDAGEEWEKSISNKLETADIILLLISPHFRASKFCINTELKRAMERHDSGEVCVIPVFLRPCDWKAEVFGKLQGVPDDAKPITRWEDRDEAFTIVTRSIRNAAVVVAERRKVQERAEQEAEAKHLAEEQARQEAEANAKRAAEERARKEAEARQAAEERTRQTEERLRQEVAARQAAEEQARQEREAKREVEKRLDEAIKARYEAEEKAHRGEEAKARRTVEERARQNAKVQAKRIPEESTSSGKVESGNSLSTLQELPAYWNQYGPAPTRDPVIKAILAVSITIAIIIFVTIINTH